jgi:hypothetical protein
MELLSAELRLLKAAIVQLHDRFDLLLAEITEMQHEYHAEHSTKAAEHQPEKDQQDFVESKLIAHCEHEELSANTAPQQEPRTLSECLAELKSDQPAPADTCLVTFPSSVLTDDSNSTNEEALVARKSIVGRCQTEMAMASPLDMSSPPEVLDASSAIAAPSAPSNQPGPGIERAAGLIPPPDIMASRARRERPISHWPLLAIIITFAIAHMSPLPVLIEYAAADSP